MDIPTGSNLDAIFEDKGTEPEAEEQAEELPADPQPEESPEGEAPLEGEETPEETPEEEKAKEVPYHENPRFRKLIEERNRLREDNRTYEDRLTALERTKERPEAAPTSVPDWFTEAFGADPKLYAKYRAHSDAERSQLREELREEIRAEAGKKADEGRKWEEWVETQLESLEDDGLKFDRNELMKFASDYTVVGKDGNIDFRKAHELLGKVKEGGKTGGKSNERKKLGALGTQKGEPTEKPKVYTSEEIRKTGWGQV